MPESNELTGGDFIALVKELNEHEAELKIKLAKAGVGEAERREAPAGDQPLS